MLHSIQDVILHVCKNELFVHVPVVNVVNGINRAVNTDITTVIAGNKNWAVCNPDWRILADVDDVVELNGKKYIIGTPCYLGATDRLNIMQKTVVIGTIDKTWFYETLDGEIFEDAIYRD